MPSHEMAQSMLVNPRALNPEDIFGGPDLNGSPTKEQLSEALKAHQRILDRAYNIWPDKEGLKMVLSWEAKNNPSNFFHQERTWPYSLFIIKRLEEKQLITHLQADAARFDSMGMILHDEAKEVITSSPVESDQIFKQKYPIDPNNPKKDPRPLKVLGQHASHAGLGENVIDHWRDQGYVHIPDQIARRIKAVMKYHHTYKAHFPGEEIEYIVTERGPRPPYYTDEEWENVNILGNHNTHGNVPDEYEIAAWSTADIFDALTANRGYRDKPVLPREVVDAELRRYMPDKRIINAFGCDPTYAEFYREQIIGITHEMHSQPHLAALRIEPDVYELTWGQRPLIEGGNHLMEQTAEAIWKQDGEQIIIHQDVLANEYAKLGY